MKINKALISVSDKSDLEKLVEVLNQFEIEIFSTGGTYKSLEKIAVNLKEVEEYTGFPEILGGRVKTLHSKIFSSILADFSNQDHKKDIEENGILNINLVVVNLYPFVETLAQTTDSKILIEKIDIGGPSMIRAAAKNYSNITVITDHNDYKLLANELKENNGEVTLGFRRKMAVKAFQMIAEYDIAIAKWMQESENSDHSDLDESVINQQLSVNKLSQLSFVKQLRYGENSHQKASLYQYNSISSKNMMGLTQLAGIELSYNNILDVDSAINIIDAFEKPTSVIIKHNNPCAIASANDIESAYNKSIMADKKSAFGGVAAFNREISVSTAKLILNHFFEIIILPKISDEVLELLSKKKKMRILINSNSEKDPFVIRSIKNGLLIQDRNQNWVTKEDIKCVTKLEPKESEIEDLLFAFNVSKFVKSNTIILAHNLTTVGIGAGQMSRVDAVSLSGIKWQEHQESMGYSSDESSLIKPVLASDAFFPFADNIYLAKEIGVSAIIQPEGSIRDQEVIDAANEVGISLLFTRNRNFFH